MTHPRNWRIGLAICVATAWAGFMVALLPLFMDRPGPIVLTAAGIATGTCFGRAWELWHLVMLVRRIENMTQAELEELVRQGVIESEGPEQ